MKTGLATGAGGRRSHRRRGLSRRSRGLWWTFPSSPPFRRSEWEGLAVEVNIWSGRVVVGACVSLMKRWTYDKLIKCVKASPQGGLIEPKVSEVHKLMLRGLDGFEVTAVGAVEPRRQLSKRLVMQQAAGGLGLRTTS